MAKIEGIAQAGEGAIHLELAMTESINGPVKGVLKRSISYAQLEGVRYSRRFLRRPVLCFTANTLECFESLPGAAGFEYSINPLCTKSEGRSFVAEVQLAVAEATMDEFTRQIEDAGGGE